MTVGIRHLLISGALLMVASVAAAQELWRGAQVGMSPAQVVNTFPGSNRLDSPHKLPKGDMGYVQLADVKHAGETFTATFYFRLGNLQTVALSHADRIPYDQARRRLERMVAEMRRSLGPETTHETFTKPSQVDRYVWVRQKELLEIDTYALRDSDKDAAGLTVVFRPAVPPK